MTAGKDKGTVLVVTLWILAILALLAIGIGFRSTIDLRLVSYQVDALKAYELAKAGIIKAIAGLENDKSATDTLWECGITLEADETFDEKFKNVPLGEGYFTVSCIEDLQGKIDVNTAPREVLMQLLAAAPNAGELTDSIRAWRGDKDAVTTGGYSGDYQCKGAPFDILGELLLVKDITPEIYFGQSETDGLKYFLTVYGPREFKININTVDETGLAAALRALELSPDAAASIVAYRAAQDPDIKKRMVFRNFAEVEAFFGEAEGGGKDPKLANLEPWILFGSQYFRICATGTLSGQKSNISKTINCVVKRETTATPPHKTEIIGWFED